MRTLTLITVLLLFASSCSTKYETEIAKIDNWLVNLDSAKKQLHSMDTGLVYKRIVMSDKNLAIIFKTKDTIERSYAFLIDDYANCKKLYGKIAQKFPSLFEEIETIPRQLENLKTDLSKNLIEKEKVDGYMLNEGMAAENIIRIIKESETSINNLDAVFNESHEKILHLIQTLDDGDENDVES